MPLAYSTVLELGQGMVGGKQWDVRMAKIRKPDQEKGRDVGAKGEQDLGSAISVGRQTWSQKARSAVAGWLMQGLEGKGANENERKAETHGNAAPQERWEMVARPSVGHRVAGGGFLGVWKKKRLDEDAGT